jgi:flagellar protein FlaG
MKIESINTKTADPVRIVSSGVGSETIAQASTSGYKKASQPHRALEKETRSAEVIKNEKRSAEEIRKDLDVINAQLKIMNRSIQFSIDDSSHDIVVKVINKESGEVIRQLPPESAIRLREHMTEVSGLIVEEEV